MNESIVNQRMSATDNSIIHNPIMVGGGYYERRPKEKGAPKPNPIVSNDCVFIVHGRDNPIKNMVSQFLKERGLDVIILHEKPNEGKTIIEKLEKYASDADYVVVLLTPDDVGGLASTPSNLSPRARQNVIFELGYFYGKLKRNKVCALYKGVEQPSDIDGVLYIPIDQSGAWKDGLVKELKAAGIKVDLDRTF